MLTNLIRMVRLAVGTWRQRVTARVEIVASYFRQQTCPHIFQAALVSGKPGRVCKLCDLAQALSREDFYAQFGERYQALLHIGPMSGAGLGDTRVTQESSLLH